MEKEKVESNRRAVNQDPSWQSGPFILEENDFSEIKDFLLECVSSIKNELYRDDLKFLLIGDWANVNRYGDYNTSHVHDNSHWSCTYYVTETDTAPLYFIDPRSVKNMDTSHLFLKNEHSHSTWSRFANISAMPGHVIFFPSWLEHGVTKNSTDNPRISIAANFLIGE